jgi:hypothetical protein
MEGIEKAVMLVEQSLFLQRQSQNSFNTTSVDEKAEAPVVLL